MQVFLLLLFDYVYCVLNMKSKPTLFAERGGRGTGERQTVPLKAERMVLLEVALEMLEVALHWGEMGREA